jgi:hypothetical protein
MELYFQTWQNTGMAELNPSVPEGYLPIAEAANRANVSEKTIRNWAKRRLVGQRDHKRPGITPIKVYRMADIDAQVAKQAEVVVGGLPAPVMATMTALAERVTAAPTLAPAAAVSLAEKHWLNYGEGVRLSGLGESRLRELVEAGEVKTERGPRGSVVLRRLDLERVAGLR